MTERLSHHSLARRAATLTVLGLALTLVACQDAPVPTDQCVLYTWNRDADGDGYGDPGDSQEACVAPDGFVGNAEDCDDSDSGRYPQRWFPDGDGDGYGAPNRETVACDAPDGFVANAGDCHDGDAAKNRLVVLYPDADGDGYGDSASAGSELCGATDGYADNALDCDDGDTSIGPSVAYFPDEDGDGYGDPNADPTYSCAPVQGLVSTDFAVDCDDSEATVHPGAAEVCDDGTALDNDCDGLLDEDDPSFDPATLKQFYLDADRDGFGVADVEFYWACEAPDRFADNTDDCDDSDAQIYPGGVEICDGDISVDNDCDGLYDDADPSLDVSSLLAWYPDVDGDGYGDPSATPEMACAPSDSTWVRDATDCAPDDVDTFPAATEICDGVANDCDDTAWVSDAGLVTFWSNSTPGERGVSMAAAFSLMASGVITSLTLSDGTLRICEGDWRAQLILEGDIEVIGVGEHGSVRLLGMTTTLNDGFDYRVIETTNASDTVTLENLFITEGDRLAPTGTTGYDGTGGAVRLAGLSSATLRQITIDDSVALEGGGLYMTGVDSASLVDVTVSNCFTRYGGGGVFITDSTVTGSNVVLESNSSDQSTGGLSINNSTVTFEPDAAAASSYGLVMMYNLSLSDWEGGLYVEDSAVSVTEGYLRGDDASQGINSLGRGVTVVGSATFDGTNVEFVEFPNYSVRSDTSGNEYDYDESGPITLSCDATECTVQ